MGRRSANEETLYLQGLSSIVLLVVNKLVSLRYKKFPLMNCPAKIQGNLAILVLLALFISHPLANGNSPKVIETPPNEVMLSPSKVHGRSWADKEASKLTIETVVVGGEIRVRVRLLTTSGTPIRDASVQFYSNGKYLRRQRTDQTGNVALNLGNNWPTGRHQLEAVFRGDDSSSGSQAVAHMTVRPAVLTIETVPPLKDIGFTLNGTSFYTDEEGVARLELAIVGSYPLRLLPLTATGTNTRIKFARWEDSIFTPERELSSRRDRHLRIGFYVSHRAKQDFVDVTGKQVREDRISSFTLKARDGSRYTYSDVRQRWFRSNNVSLLINGLESTPLIYAVESVIIDGSNTVNKNQQRFEVSRDDSLWTITLILHSIRISARDALLGTPIGDGVRLEYPNGRVKALPFNEKEEVHLSRLARGLYKLQVTGAQGIAPVIPVVLSRDQEVELKVLSNLDIYGSTLIGVSLALGLLLYGRRHLFTRYTRKERRGTPLNHLD
ncbi:MAG: hypothetical protein AVDCRST_MAG93-3731 [uncultured Chloroflexia bacterium]|uniref:Ig-like domain repeat protein n=1 Tax=uncultured Chloroflexia bacterium TaxID=1672391 RepID=A0A6J4JVE7_9CHLR|nr:MAG: hypothetical protein AVDCRST_MAG93-3731 [uncultured Chloroflexia bacterium]